MLQMISYHTVCTTLAIEYKAAMGSMFSSTVPNGYACGGPAAQVEWLSLDVVKDALHVPREATFFQCDNGTALHRSGHIYYYIQ